MWPILHLVKHVSQTHWSRQSQLIYSIPMKGNQRLCIITGVRNVQPSVLCSVLMLLLWRGLDIILGLYFLSRGRNRRSNVVVVGAGDYIYI